MSVEVVKTMKPFGLFTRRQMTTRYEVHVDGNHVATFAGEAHLSEAKEKAELFAQMVRDGADEVELSNFIVDYSDIKG